MDTADIRSDYLACVRGIEAELGAPLPRFREAELTFDTANDNPAPQNPHFIRFPGLTAQAYWESTDLPPALQHSLASFAQHYPELIEEFRAQRSRARFAPAITGRFGAGEARQWFDLVDMEGALVPEAAEIFPALHARVSDLRRHGTLSKSYIARMSPGARLAEHTGGINIFLRMHFALEIPEGDCGLDVVGETRRWHNGQWLCFDDSFRHSAWNQTPHDRYVIIFRSFHPALSALERRAYLHLQRTWIQRNYTALVERFYRVAP